MWDCSFNRLQEYFSSLHKWISNSLHVLSIWVHPGFVLFIITVIVNNVFTLQLTIIISIMITETTLPMETMKVFNDLRYVGVFFPDTSVSSNKIDYHDKTEILLKVTLNTINNHPP
jgi:hypothetical protein